MELIKLLVTNHVDTTKGIFIKFNLTEALFGLTFPSALEPDVRLQAPVLHPRVTRCLHFPTDPRSAWNPPNSASPKLPLLLGI